MHKLILPLIMGLLVTTSCSDKKSSVVPTESQSASWNIPEIEADDLDFGMLDENSSKLLTLNISNGSSEAIPGSPQLSGDNSFSIAYSNCQDLLPNKKCVVKLVFKPSDNSATSRSANITYGNYSNLMIGSVNIFTTEVVKFLNGSTPISNLNLGTLKYHQGILKTLKIVNEGDVPTNYPVVLQGTSLKMVYDQCSNKVIKPNQSCVLKIYATGQGLSGQINDKVSYGDSELTIQLQVNNFEVLTQESDIKLFYKQLSIDSILNLGTINLADLQIVNVNYKNIGPEAGVVNSIDYDYDMILDNCSNKTLSPMASCLMRLSIPAVSTGIFSHELRSTINGSNSSKLIQYQVRQSGDKLTCANQIPFADIAFITWTGVEWTNCVVEQCQEFYSLANNACDYIIPIANDISLTVSEDSNSGELDFDFTTVNGNSSAEIMSPSSNGTVSLVGNKFTYTPNSNYNGLDSFTYRIFDGHSYSAVKTVSFTVNAMNDAPVGINQSFTTDEETNLSMQLNYSDIDGNTLSYSVVSGPTKGSLSGTAPNITYTPSLNLNGADSFTYKVNDGSLDSNVVTVSITINPVNDAPVLTASNSLAANINSAATASFSVADVDSSSFTHSIVQQGTKGVLSINGTTNVLTYTPNLNQYGSDVVSFRAYDGASYSNTVIVNVTITGSGLILTGDGSRTYFDGSVQRNCYDYKNSSSGAKTYTGANGDGVYKIQSGSETVNVYCDQSTDGGGWTLAAKMGDYQNAGSYSGLTTAANNVAGLTNTTVIGIGVTYSKLSNTMINNIRSSTATNSAAYRLEKVNGSFNGSYRKIFYPGACTFAQYGSNIAAAAVWCTKRSDTWNATSFVDGPAGPGWCNQPSVMTRHWFCSGTHEGLTIVNNHESSENHNIPHHRLWVR